MKPEVENIRAHRAVIFVAWGLRYVQQAIDAVKRSQGLDSYDIFIVTDSNLVGLDLGRAKLVVVDFAMDGYARKSEFYKFLPAQYDSFVFLDSDVTVLGDISLGFEKAELHGIALATANEYSLSDFKHVDRLMISEKLVPRGQVQFNSGVIFFDNSLQTRTILLEWERLCEKWLMGPEGRLLDQPFLSLAIEMCNGNPYLLSRNYNFRPRREAIIGEVRIWHSWRQCPSNINEYLGWRSFSQKTGRFIPLSSRRQRAKNRLRAIMGQFLPRR